MSTIATTYDNYPGSNISQYLLNVIGNDDNRIMVLPTVFKYAGETKI